MKALLALLVACKSEYDDAWVVRDAQKDIVARCSASGAVPELRDLPS